MRIGLPETISSEILTLCAQIVPGTLPQFLPVTPAPGAVPDNCFIEVEKQIQACGGSARHGWAIWETPFIMLEAEAHSVWVDDGGELHDITPKRLGFERVLFLPDPEMIYSDRQVRTIFHPLSDAGATLVEVQNQKFEFMNRGDRADQHGEIKLVGDEANEWEAILASELMVSMLAFQYAVAQGLPLEELEKLMPRGPAV
ncbi:MAG: hypothetical protein WDO74_16970 [Pseudomonadota bacterium]